MPALSGDAEAANKTLIDYFLPMPVQGKFTKDAWGAEILPSMWSDNYVSLLPGETILLRSLLVSQFRRSPVFWNASMMRSRFLVTGFTFVAEGAAVAGACCD